MSPQSLQMTTIIAQAAGTVIRFTGLGTASSGDTGGLRVRTGCGPWSANTEADPTDAGGA
jgi:hypothetical protein